MNKVSAIPKVTIVTVTYNCVNNVEATIKSVISQDYPNFEYIIIDGMSTDGTLNVINLYKNKINLIISEPDTGLYDAMNKGIIHASGQWIAFMNAGDEYYSTKTISYIFNSINVNTNLKVVYGKTEYIHKKGKTTIHQTATIDNLNWTINRYQPYTHQAVFYNIDCKEDCLYKLEYKIAADYDVACRYWNKYVKKQYKYIPVIVCKFKAYDGVSTNPINAKKLLKEQIRIKIHNKMNILEILKDIIRYLKMCFNIFLIKGL